MMICSQSCWRWLTCLTLTALRCLIVGDSGTLMKTSISAQSIICKSWLCMPTAFCLSLSEKFVSCNRGTLWRICWCCLTFSHDCYVVQWPSQIWYKFAVIISKQSDHCKNSQKINAWVEHDFVCSLVTDNWWVTLNLLCIRTWSLLLVSSYSSLK